MKGFEKTFLNTCESCLRLTLEEKKKVKHLWQASSDILCQDTDKNGRNARTSKERVSHLHHPAKTQPCRPTLARTTASLIRRPNAHGIPLYGAIAVLPDADESPANAHSE